MSSEKSATAYMLLAAEALERHRRVLAVLGSSSNGER
jgi:hypothetical protein